MAKDQGANLPTTRSKTAGSAAGGGAVTADAQPAKKRTSPGQFAKEVRAEVKKITWTSWKETWINSILVFILVAITAVFFLLVDGSLSFLIQQLLRLAAS